MKQGSTISIDILKGVSREEGAQDSRLVEKTGHVPHLRELEEELVERPQVDG